MRPKTCRIFKYFVGIKTLEMRYSMANSWKEAETLLQSADMVISVFADANEW